MQWTQTPSWCVRDLWLHSGPTPAGQGTATRTKLGQLGIEPMGIGCYSLTQFIMLAPRGRKGGGRAAHWQDSKATSAPKRQNLPRMSQDVSAPWYFSSAPRFLTSHLEQEAWGAGPWRAVGGTRRHPGLADFRGPGSTCRPSFDSFGSSCLYEAQDWHCGLFPIFIRVILPGSSGPMSLQAQAACFQRSEPSENLWSRRAGDVTPGVTLLSCHQVLQFSFGKVAGQTKPADVSRPVSAGPGTCRHLPTHLCSTVKASGVKKAAREPLLEAAMTGSQMGSLVKSVIPVRK